LLETLDRAASITFRNVVRGRATRRCLMTPTARPDLSVLAIKRHCASRLPAYMVPSNIRLLTDMPRTSSGKVDRVGLRTALVAPTTPTDSQTPRNL